MISDPMDCDDVEGTVEERLEAAKVDQRPGKGPLSVLTKKEQPVREKCCPQRISPFKDNRPRPCWMRAFLKRHRNVVDRTCGNVTAASTCVSEANIRGWFTSIDEILQEEDV
ncbi:hypothetical protein ILUMI_16104, partial [Ignelater luminosus]